MKWMLVFLGSGLGGCLRLLTSEITARYVTRNFPLATLASNLIACLLLGLVLGFFEQTKVLDQRMRLFLGTGICGGYSTFSTFSNETLQLFSSQKIMEGILYAGSSLLFGLLAVFLGYSLTSTSLFK